MALILGDEITTLDLVPIFNGFLRDLDEVRIGVLKHFADFTKVCMKFVKIRNFRVNQVSLTPVLVLWGRSHVALHLRR